MTADQNPERRSAPELLAGLWAKKYIRSLMDYAWDSSKPTSDQAQAHQQTAQQLLETLRFASSQAWARTEVLLSSEVQRHQIDPSLIDPWNIAADSRILFEQAMQSYAAQLSPEQFSVVIAPECGRIRQHYTQHDARVLGFMSMQFHYTGQLLLDQIDPETQLRVHDYLKVMDDHLYMPLERSYEAAAQHEYDGPALTAVHQLLPLTTSIAESISAEVAQQRPGYHSISGSLEDLRIRVSSVRDVEMFQVYLCLCALENNLTAIQQELFPLCIMLYPPLRVDWDLIRSMLRLLDRVFQEQLTFSNYQILAHPLEALQAMFAPEVFAEAG